MFLQAPCGYGELASIGEGEIFGDLEMLQQNLFEHDGNNYDHNWDGVMESSVVVTSSAFCYFYITNAQIVKNFPAGTHFMYMLVGT
jgi:hypothetical protein